MGIDIFLGEGKKAGQRRLEFKLGINFSRLGQEKFSIIGFTGVTRK